MAVAQAATVVAAAAACRGISPSGTTGVFRWRPRRRALARARPARRGSRATGRGRGLVVVAEFGGMYEDGFEDVHKVHGTRCACARPHSPDHVASSICRLTLIGSSSNEASTRFSLVWCVN